MRQLALLLLGDAREVMAVAGDVISAGLGDANVAMVAEIFLLEHGFLVCLVQVLASRACA